MICSLCSGLLIELGLLQQAMIQVMPFPEGIQVGPRRKHWMVGFAADKVVLLIWLQD